MNHKDNAVQMPGFRVLPPPQVPMHTYIEGGYQEIPSVYLSDEEYARALQCFVPACTDVVPIRNEKRTIYLARRKQKPMIDWWWVGGRMKPNETFLDSAVRCFRRETKLDIDPGRLVLRAVNDYFLKDRQQEPQNVGCHMLGITFSLEITPEELKQTRLDENGYEQNELDPFTREDLLKASVFPAVLDMYDLIFPTNA